MTTALVTGITGQDGAYLAHALLARDDRVIGTTMASTPEDRGSLAALGVDRDVEVIGLDLADPSSVRAAVDHARPDRVYHLAAMSSVALAWERPLLCAEVNAMGTIALVEALRELAPEAHLVNASSSEIYALAADGRLNENSPFGPRNPYGSAKLHAHLAVAQAREAHGLHGSNAVLFGHESPIRPDNFVSRKITSTLARIAKGADETLHLGNIAAERDWGHAEDYVEAMLLMGEAETPGDCIVATGKLLSVRGFVDAAAEAAGLPLEWTGEGLEERGRHDGRTIVAIDERFFRPVDTAAACGEPGRLKALGWKPTRTARDVAIEMVRADMDAL